MIWNLKLKLKNRKPDLLDLFHYYKANIVGFFHG